MSTTITQTEQCSVEKIREVPKRSTFIRSSSIEKLKKFNNFVCSQHYLLLPAILVWLKQSRTILKSHTEKCLTYLKTMLVTLYLRKVIQQRVLTLHLHKQTLTISAKASAENIAQDLKIYLRIFYEQSKRYLLIFLVYLALVVLFLHTVGCVMFICLNIPPLGFFFLIGCLGLMARIKFRILDKINAESERNCRFNLAGKTISKVKLF